tara:strand:- start:231 stop:2090 length:1860 start_codon:yes stop_codon:yes gene_type:complete
MKNLNSFNSELFIEINNQNFIYFDLNQVAKKFDIDLNKIPISIKVILENLLRNEDGENISKSMISKVFSSLKDKNKKNEKIEIAFFPTRVLMQDFTGVPAVADLAAMRNALKSNGIEPKKINPLSRVDLVIDHSVMVDNYKNSSSLTENVKKEFDRNKERYEFLKWGQSSFDNFYLVPPGAGICHQVNLENIAKTVWLKETGDKKYIFPDSVVGTDSHTTMVNSLSVLGWGVGGIEAEAAMLGQAISMNVPEVIGFELKGSLKEGITATDLVLSITKILRDKGVVGKFVEFFGNGLKNLSLADRATISNMAPEYGATCGFFPTDEETINYHKLTGKDNEHLNIVEKYSKKQTLWADENYAPEYSDKIMLDLDSIEPSLAGPKRPQDKILLKEVPAEFSKMVNKINNYKDKLNTGDIVIAAIVKDLSVERSDKKIFENINLSLAPGNITILKGKNGSGKTTLLKSILNIIEPSFGSIYWKGKLLRKNLYDFYNNVTYIPDTTSSLKKLTINDNINIWKKFFISNISNSQIETALKTLKLDYYLNKRVGTLSFGETKKLEFLRLIIENKKVWILDEPLSNLDEGSIELMKQTFENHCAKEGSIIFSSHQNPGIYVTEEMQL